MGHRGIPAQLVSPARLVIADLVDPSDVAAIPAQLVSPARLVSTETWG